jgi:hypothetical protein
VGGCCSNYNGVAVETTTKNNLLNNNKIDNNKLLATKESELF